MKTLVLLVVSIWSLSTATVVAQGQGCSPYAHAVGGTVFWGGCPTLSCGDYPNECQTQGQGASLSCSCLDNPQTGACKAKIKFMPDGETVSTWSCINQLCPHACTLTNPVPIDGYFYFCWC